MTRSDLYVCDRAACGVTANKRGLGKPDGWVGVDGEVAGTHLFLHFCSWDCFALFFGGQPSDIRQALALTNH